MVTTTSTKGSRVVGALTLVLLGATLLFGLVLSPADEVQRDAVRLMYVHVPTAWLAFLAFGVTAFASVMYLWKRTRSYTWDRIAGASAEIGVVFTALCLIAGSIWGKVSWGVYWTWDARLTSTALLFVLFLGYGAIRRIQASPDVRARRSAWAALIAFVDVPIVHQSVVWWRTLHQKPTVLRADLDPQISGLMLFTLFLATIAFTVLYVWLMMHRMRVSMMEEAIEAKGLDLALAERHAEALADGVRGPDLSAVLP